MSKRWKTVFALAGITVLATVLVGQEKPAADKKGGSRASRILHPEMTVEKGTYAKPMASLGEKTDEPWSGTTLAASVDGKPQQGRVVTLAGEVVDFSCYLQVGKHGEKHRSCGQKCIQNSQPAGLLTRDGTLYMLMPEEHDPRRDGGVDFRPAAVEHMGHIVTVTGTEASHNGFRALFVTGFAKK
jgi:hypothetical protein